MSPEAEAVAFTIDKIALRSGEIVASHLAMDRDPWSALMQVTSTFHDADAPEFLGVYGFTCGDLRIEDEDDLHFWMVTWNPDVMNRHRPPARPPSA